MAISLKNHLVNCEFMMHIGKVDCIFFNNTNYSLGKKK